MAIYVFAQDADDFGTMGLCGPLTPTQCRHQEKRNGLSQLTLAHPIDSAGRWAALTPGRIIGAEVPVRTTAEIDEDGELITTVEKWRMKTTATKGQRGLYSKASGGKRLKTLPVWADKKKTQRLSLTATRKGENRYKVKTKYGSGWVSIAAIEYEIIETIPNIPTAIEAVEPAWTVKPQLFRIREAEVTAQGVTVTASHIFYDLAGNLTTWSGYVKETDTNNPTCVQALDGVMAGALMPHEFEGRTNLLDRRVQVTWTNENVLEALMAPDTGILDRWGAELVRDNYEFTILREAGLNRGVRIEYGKNLLGVTVTTDVTDVITRVMPIGKTHKDKPLYLTAGTYNINDTIVTIGPGEKWVTSAEAANYPTPLIAKLDTDIKAKSGGNEDVLAARKKMIERALLLFQDEGADRPSVNVRVEFLKLGDTIEYEQYKNLDTLFLCDRARVRHPGIGVDVLTEVIETVWDCLSGRFETIELGSVQLDLTRASVQPYQLASGISGTLLASGTVPGDALGEGSIDTAHIQLAAITQALIADLAVGTAQIADLAVDRAKIKDAAVGRAQIADAAIGQAQIDVASIDWASIANLSASIAVIARAQITTANIEAAHIDWAQIETLAAQMASVARAQITTANINQANINWAEIASLSAAVAEIARVQIGSAEIDFGQIKDLVAGTAIITEGVGGKLLINRLDVVDGNIVSLNAGKINAGTLSVERLIITGSDKSIVYAINSVNGTPQLSSTTIDGGALTQRTVTADRIVAAGITAAELAAGCVTADKILALAIQAGHIQAGAIEAQHIQAGAVTVGKLASDVGAALDISSNVAITSRVTQGAYEDGIASLQDADNSLATQIEQTAQEITLRVSAADLEQYLRFKNGVVSVGNTQSPIDATISNDKFAIRESGNDITWMSQSALHAKTVEIENQLKIGDFSLTAFADGSVAFLRT